MTGMMESQSVPHTGITAFVYKYCQPAHPFRITQMNICERVFLNSTPPHGIAAIAYPALLPGYQREGRTSPHVVHRLRSEEHTSELQSLMRISYAVFCLKNKNSTHTPTTHNHID